MALGRPIGQSSIVLLEPCVSVRLNGIDAEEDRTHFRILVHISTGVRKVAEIIALVRTKLRELTWRTNNTAAISA